MEKLKIYLETTVFNFCLDENVENREKRNAARKILDEVLAGKYTAYVSSFVMDELGGAGVQRRKNLFSLVEQYPLIMVGLNDEVEKIANLYLDEGVIPRKKFTDAYHLAITTAHGLDYIVSYNLEHIAKTRAALFVAEINMRENYRAIGIVSPGGRTK